MSAYGEREGDIFSSLQHDAAAAHAQTQRMAREREERLHSACRALCSTREGRELVRHVVGGCDPLTQQCIESAHAAYYRQGVRSVGLGMFSLFYEAGCDIMTILMDSKEEQQR